MLWIHQKTFNATVKIDFVSGDLRLFFYVGRSSNTLHKDGSDSEKSSQF